MERRRGRSAWRRLTLRRPRSHLRLPKRLRDTPLKMHGEGVETRHYSLSWKSADTCADISATQSATPAAADEIVKCNPLSII